MAQMDPRFGLDEFGTVRLKDLLFEVRGKRKDPIWEHEAVQTGFELLCG